MKQFKGLIQKEWNTYKKVFMVPIWLAIGFYALNILLSLYSLTRHNFVFTVPIDINPDHLNLGTYFIAQIAAILPYGLMIIFIIKIVSDMMNDDFKNKCAIFHLAQPVSIFKVIIAKISLVLFAGYTIPLVIALVNQVIFSSIFRYYADFQVSYSYIAFIQTSLIVIIPIVFLSSLFLMLETIFQKKSYMYVVGAFVIETLINIANRVWSLKVPSLINNIIYLSIGKTMTNPFDSQKYLFQKVSNGAYSILTQSIQEIWINLFDILNLWRLVLSVLFIVIAYYFYKSREIA
ncbi:MAG: hypothetical protein RBS16_00390 [Candidatus Cloacimonadales bacterium]|jgi:ABC-type transport system involved in multi-copper enzyme maturation permease subunit|nr:hypothetical protein [Candidatus Cloacimonadota bacterium]MDD2650190.1 hypothetical protein [Candidatus Cloacimonadota bacterium]MDD3501929.1 hypothetical protein [Candidatus Cloacimonadota bacterium]MDX9976470.1 hypothetical protein [Candidatus Cloacimonadales bacterium]